MYKHIRLILCYLVVLSVIGVVYPHNAFSAEKSDGIVNWKLQCSFPPPEKNTMGYWSTYGISCEVARRVKMRTNGEFVIKVYGPNSLFKVMETPHALKVGAIEMLCSNGGYHASTVPEAMFEFGFPYGSKNSDEVYRLLYKTRYFNTVKKAYAEKHNAYLLGLISGGSYNYLTRFPIRCLEDLKGKKIRGTGATIQIIRAHGGIPVQLSGAEQYMALQRGTVDGTIYPPHAGITYKMFEVVKYQSWPPVFAVMGANFLVNMDAWAHLPLKYQNILQEEVDEMISYTFEKSGPALERLAREEGKKQYDTVSIYLTDQEYTKFRSKVLPLWDQWGDSTDFIRTLVNITKAECDID